MKLSNITVNLR